MSGIFFIIAEECRFRKVRDGGKKGYYMEFVPKWIAWEITRRCNLRCVHCRSSSEMGIKGHPDFSTEEAFRVLDDIVSYATPVVVLSGGEPLTRPDVFEIAKYGTGKGLRMGG